MWCTYPADHIPTGYMATYIILSLVMDLLGLNDVPFQLPGEPTSLQTFCAIDFFYYRIYFPSLSHLSEMKHVGTQH